MTENARQDLAASVAADQQRKYDLMDDMVESLLPKFTVRQMITLWEELDPETWLSPTYARGFVTKWITAAVDRDELVQTFRTGADGIRRAYYARSTRAPK